MSHEPKTVTRGCVIPADLFLNCLSLTWPILNYWTKIILKRFVLDKMRLLQVISNTVNSVSKSAKSSKVYSGVSNKRVNTDHVHLQNPNSTRAYWIPTRSVSSEARSAEAANLFLKIQTFGTKSIFVTSFQQWNLKIKVVHFNAWNNGEFASFTLLFFA